MAATSQTSSLSPRWRVTLYVLLGITVLNYVAQIPYYIHFYGVHHVGPAPFAIAFLLVTFALFLAGYLLILQAKYECGAATRSFALLNQRGACKST